MESNTFRNVLGGQLELCCLNPLTGYFRDGFCRTKDEDLGSHVICAVMTEKFLEHSWLVGNDLITPRPDFRFPGLKPGDHWCVCASRWAEALEAGCAPPVILERCHEKALEFASLEDLKKHAWKA